MTKPYVPIEHCNNCGDPVDTRSPFSQWIGKLPYPLNSGMADCENLDFVWFQYRKGWLITIEEKRYGARSNPAQADTHGLVAQMLAFASGHQFTAGIGARRKLQPIQYRGHFVVSFQKNTPDDSEWVRINDVVFHDPVVAVKTLLTHGKPPTLQAVQNQRVGIANRE